MSWRTPLLSFLWLSWALAVAGCSRGDGAARPAEEPIAVEVQPLRPTRLRDTTEYLATLKSRRSIVLQPLVEGQLAHIFVKSGDRVIPGQPIMQIDPQRQRASVTSAQASRVARQASLDFARQAFDRAQRLFGGGAVSQQELDAARSRYQSAEAEVRALGAQLRENQVQLDYYKITAPAHGVIGDVPVRVGDRVGPATRLTTLDDNRLLEAYIALPVERAAEVRLGMAVVLVDGLGTELGQSTVSFISPQVDEATQSILVKAIVPNDESREGRAQGDGARGGRALRAAQFMRARLVWSTHEGVAVPVVAVQRLTGQAFVFVVEARGGQRVARQRPVSLGELGAEGYPVLAGLRAGEQIVTGGIQKLTDGAPITAAPPAPAATDVATAH